VFPVVIPDNMKSIVIHAEKCVPRFNDVFLEYAQDRGFVIDAATDQERRVLIEELLEWVTVLPDQLEVTVTGAPPLAVSYGEVGLKESQIVGVGGGRAQSGTTHWRLRPMA
jgi:hypothetical protein